MAPKTSFTKKVVSLDKTEFTFNEMSAMEVALNESVTMAEGDFQRIADIASAAGKLGLDVSQPQDDTVDSEDSEEEAGNLADEYQS